MTKREKYAIGQHDLACDDLGVGKSGDSPGPSLHEAVCELRDAVRSVETLAVTHKHLFTPQLGSALVMLAAGKAGNFRTREDEPL